MNKETESSEQFGFKEIKQKKAAARATTVTSLGARIKELRIKNGLTQAELAQILGISTSTIGMYEQGRREPDNATIIALSKKFDTTVDYLLNVQGGSYSPTEKKTAEVDLENVIEYMLSANLTLQGSPIKPKEKERLATAFKLALTLLK